MAESIRNPSSRKTLRIMLGNMYPSEMSDLTEDRQIMKTLVPDWIERTLHEECTYVVNRLPRYEAKIKEKYGPIDTLIGKLMVYHTVRDNWDSLEPCNFTRMMPLRCYFDDQIPDDIKRRIDRSRK